MNHQTMPDHPSRRAFLKATGASLASLASFNVLPTLALAQGSPNERIRLAVIGTGGKGKSHCKSFSQIPGCEVVAVCDVDPERLNQAAASLPSAAKVRQYDDYRRLLDDPSIDSVCIATCDHWHTPIALAAILAGKYDRCQLICEMRLWTDYPMEGHDNGTIFYGTEGRLEDGRSGVKVIMKDGKTQTIEGVGGNHQEDFLSAVRANEPSKSSAPIERGAISAELCHLGNIGTRLGGQRVEFDPVAQRITRCGGREAEANTLLTRTWLHSCSHGLKAVA